MNPIDELGLTKQEIEHLLDEGTVLGEHASYVRSLPPISNTRQFRRMVEEMKLRNEMTKAVNEHKELAGEAAKVAKAERRIDDLLDDANTLRSQVNDLTLERDELKRELHHAIAKNAMAVSGSD